ncbi:MAG: hypothetical protein K9M07_07175 [Simkaniaceae bacterium]|nr:hypothetical protein [Simkaniaceae bacterium]MCF7853003.1 hypothetical protein [Simkaniaceae bacterium]
MASSSISPSSRRSPETTESLTVSPRDILQEFHQKIAGILPSPLTLLDTAINYRRVDDITYLLSKNLIPEAKVIEGAHKVARIGNQELLTPFLNRMSPDQINRFLANCLNNGRLSSIQCLLKTGLIPHEMLATFADQVIINNHEHLLVLFLPYLSSEKLAHITLTCACNYQLPLLIAELNYLRITRPDFRQTVLNTIAAQITSRFSPSDQFLIYGRLIDQATLLGDFFDLMTPIIRSTSLELFSALINQSIIDNDLSKLRYLLESSHHPIFSEPYPHNTITIMTNAFYYAAEQNNTPILTYLFSLSIRGRSSNSLIDRPLFEQIRAARSLNNTSYYNFLNLYNSSLLH